MSQHAPTLPHGGAMEESRTTPFWWRLAWPGVVTSAVLCALYLASMAWLQAFPRDVSGYVIGRDFLNFWTLGRLALADDPGRFYDWQAYNAYLQGFLGADYPLQQWSYPPHLMLLAVPFGQLPYLAAYTLWTGLGITALHYAARPWIAERRAASVLFLSPAALLCFICGQNAFFTAAALIMVYRWRDERPVLAGILLGLMTVKPQLGLLFPLVLLVSRRFSLFASAAATAVALLGATIALFGTEIFIAYHQYAVPIQKSVVTDPTAILQSLMPTLYMSLRLLGLSVIACTVLQGIACVALAGLAVWAYARQREPLLSYALLVTATTLATPYILSYDLVVFGWIFLVLGLSNDPDKAGRAVLAAVYFLPMIALALGAAGIPGAALVPAAFLYWLHGGLTGRLKVGIVSPEAAHG
ncbi:MAG TPA: glycosyltransferase family 87 protein [Afifellaceae bacterium]|nr:glycosyltransferase family 87 protein [Afifellaceae bacterium]